MKDLFGCHEAVPLMLKKTPTLVLLVFDQMIEVHRKLVHHCFFSNALLGGLSPLLAPSSLSRFLTLLCFFFGEVLYALSCPCGHSFSAFCPISLTAGFVTHFPPIACGKGRSALTDLQAQFL